MSECVTSLVRRVAGTRQLLAVLCAGLSTLLWCAVTYDLSHAGAPEYMKLRAAPGMALEIEGSWDASGVFVAKDIEVLPNSRSPKLRGAIQSLDRKGGFLVMYGQRIAVTEVTEFVEVGGESSSWDRLEAGQRVEITCKVDSQRTWSARKIATQAIKKSDKIKGTVSRTQIDGNAPDTLDMSGLLILLRNETDILEPQGTLVPTGEELFDDLGRERVEDIPGGWPLGQRARAAVEYRFNAYDENEYDLTTSADSDLRGTQHQVRLILSAFATSQVRLRANLRLTKTFYHTNERGAAGDTLAVYFTELFALVQPHATPGLALMVGRQRFREPREWLFDEYLDAVRIFYRGPSHLVWEGAYVHAVEPIKSQFSTWTDYFFQMRWYTDEESRASAYVLARRDSDASRKRQPVWYGVRYWGNVNRYVRAWADLSLGRGEDKHEDVEAWAVDLGTTLTAEGSAVKPALTFGYAAASGDDTGADNIDHSYRQTGYEDNSGRMASRGRTKYYGNLLDPELSNLRVLTAGVGLRPTRKSSVEVGYHSYSQAEPDNDLQGSDLVDPPARPNGSSTDLGWALDLVIRFPRLWNVLTLKWVSAVFNPGLAYEPRKETAYLNQLHVTVAM